MPGKIPAGLGFYIWNLSSLPDAKTTAKTLKDIGCKWVAIKVQDNVSKFNVKGGNDKPLMAFIDTLEAAGIDVGGWGWISPLPAFSPGGEAGVTSERIAKLGLKFFLVDAEHYVSGDINSPWMTSKDRVRSANTYMNQLDVNEKFPVALSSYREPLKNQPQFPVKQFVNHPQSKFVAPQMYWLGAHNPAEQLARCAAEYKSIAKELPLVPIGSAWGQKVNNVYWEPTVKDIQDFIAAAKAMGCPAWGFWSFDWIWQHKRSDWMQAMSGGVVVDPPVDPPVEDPTTFPKTLVWASGVKMVNLRLGPAVGSNDVGDLLAPAQPVALEEKKVTKGTLVRISGDIWVAKEYDGKTYFNYA